MLIRRVRRSSTEMPDHPLFRCQCGGPKRGFDFPAPVRANAVPANHLEPALRWMWNPDGPPPSLHDGPPPPLLQTQSTSAIAGSAVLVRRFHPDRKKL